MKFAQPVLVDPALLRQLKALSREVRQAREFHRLSVQELAEQADIGIDEVERLESGEPGVAVLSVCRALRALDLSSQMLPGALLLMPTQKRAETVRGPRPQERLAA